MKKEKNIAFVRIDILENWRFWNKFQKTGDFEAAGREVIAQANALLEQDYDSNERAATLLKEGKEFQNKRRFAGQKGGRQRVANEQARAAKENNDQVTASDISANGSQLDAASSNAADDCKATPSSNNLVADGDTREGSLNFANTGNRAHLESATSATTENSPAEAPTGNEGDELLPASEEARHSSDGLSSESATSAGQRNSVRGSAKPACVQVATGRKQLPPPTKETVYDFAQESNLDKDDAREWFEINFVDRPGCDKDGVVIKNWKGHCKNYCKAKANRRKSA